MRIAVLIAGAPRTIMECSASILSLFDSTHQIDYFLYIWDDNLSDEKKHSIINTFCPQECKFSRFMNWDICRDNIAHLCNKSYDVRTIFSKSWANYAVNNMRLQFERTHGFTYDAVAFIRPDIIYGISQFDPAPHLVNSKQVIQSKSQNFGMWSDQFIICSDAAATHFAALILWMMSHLPMLESHTYPVGGECNVMTWMMMYGNYTRVVLDIPHKILRVQDIGKSFDAISDTVPQDTHLWQ